MFCKTCGCQLNENQAICLNCGVKVGEGFRFCAFCGAEVNPNAAVCLTCGCPTKGAGAAGADGWVPAGKEKIVAILLAFFLGGFGIHNFYLGETKKGILRLLTCWIGLGGILALIDFIKMLIGSYKVDPNALI